MNSAKPKPRAASAPPRGGKRRRGTTNKRRRTTQVPRTRGQKALLVARWSAIVGLALGALGAAIVVGVFWHYGSDPELPHIESLSEFRPKQATRIATPEGKVVGEIYEQRRTFLPFEQLPETLVQAFVAAEDSNYWEHEGIDYMGMARAVVVNIKAGEKRQGASTITQQVVKTFLLSPERTFKRKFQEIILARRLEQALSKEEILTLYLNQIYLGHGRYGVEEAARYYFGKGVADLHVGEMAVLASLPKAPERLSPRKPDTQRRLKFRQIYVLEQMARAKFIDTETAEYWITRPIEIVGDPYPDLNTAPEWVDLVRRELVERYGEQEIPYLGKTVVTTLDPEYQEAAQEALRSGLRALDQRQKVGRPIASIKPNKIKLQLAKYARRLPKKGPTHGGRYRAVVTEVHGDALVVDLGNWKAELSLSAAADRYNPKGLPAGERFKVGDIVRVTPLADAEAEDGKAARAPHRVAFPPLAQGAVVVIDPRTRHVMALVGGYDSQVADFNRATMAKRQPGSSFKPFVYAAAIEGGDHTASTIMNDAPEVYDLWKPQNYEKGEFQGPISLRTALARSTNTVAIRLLSEIGPDKAADLARAMGVSSRLPRELSLALGSGEVTPLELTNAYATFAAGGMAAPARFIKSIDGQPMDADEPVAALRPEVAYVAVDMMRSVVTEGTARKAAGLQLDVAGKTGTSNDARDAWFIGMTPDLVVGVWAGFDSPYSLGRGEGGSKTALPIFVDVVDRLGRKVKRRDFAPPAGVVEVRVDRATGLLAPTGAAEESTRVEVFLEGTAPTEVAPAAGEVDIDSFVLDQYGDEPQDTAPSADEAGDGELP